MALVKYPLANANSYATAAEGDTFFVTYLNASAWTGAVTATKESALVLATRDLNAEEYVGTNNTLVPGFKWARSGVVDLEGNAIDEDSIPSFITEATFELALVYLQSASVQTGSTALSNIKRVVAGSVQVEFFLPQSVEPFPPRVQRLLAPYLLPGAGDSISMSQAFGTCEESGLSDYNTSGFN